MVPTTPRCAVAMYGDAAKKCNKILADLEKHRANARAGKRQRYPGYRQNKISKLKSKYTQQDCENVLPGGAALLSPKLAEDLKDAGIDTTGNGKAAPVTKPRINLFSLGRGGGAGGGLVVAVQNGGRKEGPGGWPWLIGTLVAGAIGTVIWRRYRG